MIDSEDLVNSAIRSAVEIHYRRGQNDDLLCLDRNNKSFTECYNAEILKIAELVLLANQTNSIKQSLDELTIHLAAVARK